MLGISVAGIVIIFGWGYFEIEVLYPQRHLRLQDEAAAWNSDNWEKGIALRVTVQVLSDRALGAETATATLDCYEKRLEVVLLFRPVSSLFKMDHGFIQAASLTGFVFLS